MEAVVAATSSVALVVFALYVWDVAVSIAGLWSLPRPRESDRRVRFAVIVCAHNEARVVAGVVNSLRTQHYPRELVDIFVVADNCTDDTAAVAADAGAIVIERHDLTKRTKGYALQWGMDQVIARGPYDAVCVLDADNVAAPDFLATMRDYLSVGHRAIQGYLDIKNPDATWVTRCIALSYYLSNRTFMRARTRLGLPATLGGTGFCLDWDVFVTHRWDPGSLADDLELTMRLILARVPVTFGWYARSNVSRVGADFFINDKNTLTSSLLYKHADGKNTVDIDYRDMNASKEVFMNTLREEAELEAGRTLEGSLLYKKTFARQGREWTTLVSVIRDDDVESSDLVQTTTLTGLAPTQSLQRTANTENQRDYLAQTDYIHPFGKKGKVEGGAKITLREIENAYSVEVNNTGAWVALPDFTNELAYTENIYAAYAMFSNQYKRLTYQAGVRSEYSDIRTELVKTAQVNPRQYLNFFPSAHLSLELDERNALQTSYTRRLSRPSFRQLIPFFAYSDPRSFFGGNPDLNPEYTDSYEAGYLKKFENGSLLSSLYYRHTSNPTERITATDTTGLIRRFPVNLATKDAYGIEMNLQYEFTRWWRASASINAYQEYVQGEYRGRLYTSDALTFTGRAMMNFKLPYEINGQVSGNYTAPRRNIQGTILSRYTLDVGLSRDILKGNGTVIFSAKNVLNSNKMRSLVDTEYLYSESEFLWRARQFTLTFTYRLNQKKKPTRESMSPGFEGGEEM